jgi:cytochrome c oxidase assembly protein subunit 11
MHPILIPSTELTRRNRSVLISVLGVVFGMLMLSYASVPLYSMFCKLTGYGGTPRIGAETPSVILKRHVNVTFNTDVAPDLSWKFRSLQKNINTPIGQRNLAFFEATNTGTEPITATATFNVTPFKMGEYFVKLQCFCFNKQRLDPGESATFPVSFYVDPEVTKDKNLDEVQDITLSYTFFPVGK